MMKNELPPTAGCSRVTKVTHFLLGLYIFIFIVPLLLQDFFPSAVENPLVLHSFFIASALLFPVLLARTLFELFLLPIKPRELWSNLIMVLLIFVISWLPASTVLYGMSRIGYVSEVSIHTPDVTKSIVIKGLRVVPTEEGRAMFARINFQEYGALVPFRLDTGEYDFITPTEAQKSDFAELAQIAHEIREIQSTVATTSCIIQSNTKLYFGLLFSIFMVSLIYQTKKRPNQKLYRAVTELPPESEKKQQSIIQNLAVLSLVLVTIEQIAGDNFFPWLTVICLMFSVGIGLAQSLAFHWTLYQRRQRKTLKTLLASGIFLGLLCFGVIDMTQKTYELNVQNHKYSRPFDYLQVGKNLTATTKAPSEQKRQQAASAIYRQFGETIVYRQDNGRFEMYQPNSEDETVFEQLKAHQQNTLRLWQRDQDLGEVLYSQLRMKLFGTFMVFLAGLVYWQRRFYP